MLRTGWSRHPNLVRAENRVLTETIRGAEARLDRFRMRSD